MTSTYRVSYQLRAHRRDELIEFIKSMLLAPFVLHGDDGPRLVTEYTNVFAKIESMISEHRALRGPGSKLKDFVPTITDFFTALPLVEAFQEYDRSNHVSARRFVPISFNDVRHILNLAQVMEISKDLTLITFDGDETLYEDGGSFKKESPLLKPLCNLLRQGCCVAVVTAAGYKDAEIYEKRLQGLLDGFREEGLLPDQVNRFMVVGGECNFLFHCNAQCRLEQIPSSEFLTPEMAVWSDSDIATLLDAAEHSLQESIRRFNISSAKIIRKARAVGTAHTGPRCRREILDEITLSLKHEVMQHSKIPHCAFNSGTDVWLDIGNKLYGVEALRAYIKKTMQLDCSTSSTLHVGDQFLGTGNDVATRRACCTVWVGSPLETEAILTQIDRLYQPKHPAPS